MARLPDRTQLSGPLSLRSGRMVAREDTTAIGRGIASLGGSIEQMGREAIQQQNAVDLARAEAFKTEQMLAVQNEFDQDPDYVTFGKRAPERTSGVINRAASLIRDPRMRERWLAGAQGDAARVNDGIADAGRAKSKQAETVAFDEGLEANRRVYVDPDTPDEVREKARRDIMASIDVGEASGLFSPEEAARRRELFQDGADFTRGQLLAARNPNLILGNDASLVDRIIGAESGGKANAKNPNSSATGAGQFISSTWLKMVKQYRPDLAQGRSNEQLLALRNDVALSREMTARYAEENARYLGARGHAATAGNVYLAHFLGPAGAANVLGSGDGEALSSVLPAEVLNANPFLKGMTVAGLKGWAAKKMGGPAPQLDFMERLAPERRQALIDTAAQRQRQMTTEARAQQKAQYEAYKDSVSLSILTGGIASEQQILSDTTLNDGDKATLLRSFRTEMKDALATATAVQEFAGGNLRVDPYDADGRKTVDKVYDATVKAAPENIQPLTEELVRQTGVVPKGAMNLIRQGLTSTDVNMVEQAAQAAQRLSMINPAALSRREGGAEVQKMADDFSYYVNNLDMSAAEAAQRLRDAQDPARQRDRKALEPAAKEFVKELETADIGAIFDDSLLGLGSNPDVGFNEGQRLGIAAEYRAIAEQQFYATNGNAELALNRANEQMKRMYGVTELGSRKVVMKHPPEKYWPAMPGGDPFGYARDQIVDELAGFISDDEVRATLPSIALTGDVANTIAEVKKNMIRDSLIVMSTPETDALVKAGKLPGYFVGYVDPNGNIQTVPGELFFPDVSAVKEEAQRVTNREIEWAREDDAEMRLMQDDPEGMRDRSLDQFLEGP